MSTRRSHYQDDKPVTRRRRVSGEDDDSEDDEDQGTPQPAVKTRVMPKRAAYVHFSLVYYQ